MVEQINNIAQIWLSWMWSMLWQVSLLIAIIALADLFLRKRVWPQVRYALWLLVLIKLVIPPGFALSTSIVSQIRTHLPQNNVQVEPETASVEMPSFEIATENLLPEIEPRIEPMRREPFPFPEKDNFALPMESISQPYISNPTIVPEKINPDWKAYLMFVWLAGVIALLFWAILRYKALRKRFCTKDQKTNIPKWFEPLLKETARRLKLQNIPAIAFSNNISSPAVFGTFNPVLVLPADISLSQKNMEHILLHELAHIKRLDLKINTLTTLLQIVYWFNPLLFFAGKRLRHLRELCCDATVARILREQTTDYRMTIMESAKRFFTKPTELGMGLLGLFEDSSSLANRLKWLEKKTWKYRTVRILATFIIVTLMAIYILPMAKAKKVEAAETTIAQKEQTDDSEIDPRERASLTGKIIDYQGKPVGQAEITLYKRYSAAHTGNTILHKVGKTITSKNDGTFVLNTQKRLWVMNYRDDLGDFEEGLVVVQKDSLALSWAKWDINQDKNIDFTLTKSQSVDGIVVDETGKPVPGANVQSIIYRGKDFDTAINNWLPGISPINDLVAESDNLGRFKINRVPENCFVDFVVEAKGKATISTYQKEIGPEFKAGQKNARIVLKDEGFIEGTIVDINTGKGIEGVKVKAIPRNPSEPVSDAPRFSSSLFKPHVFVSNQDGTFKIGGLSEGYYGLTGDIPFKDGIFVEKGKTTSDIKIDCTGYVYGYVKDINGNPIANAEIHIRPAPESINIPSGATSGITFINNGKTDENGYYLVKVIKGYYTVGATAYIDENDTGYKHVYIKKDETFEGTQQVDFQFGTFPEGNATLVGEVKDQNGDILTDFYVQLSSKDENEDSKFGFGLKEIQYTTDGTFEYKNLPAGKYLISMNSLKTNDQYEFPFFHDITLEENKINKEFLEVIKKQSYYGRVLFEDGTPAYFDPPPWPNGTGRVSVPDQFGFESDSVNIDKDGYFEAFLKDDQYERIKNGEFEMKISVPSLELDRVSHYANISFPPDKLSTDKSKAGTVKIEKPSDERKLNPQNAPSLLQKQIPEFNGIEINQNTETNDNKNITVKGYVTDNLGRPRGNVFIAPEATNIWKGKRSDLQGNFVLEDVKPEQKKWVAYSQASRALGLFTIPDNYDGSPIHVSLDYVEGNVEGRVIGEQGIGLPGQDVDLVITTKDGLKYVFPSSQKTDSQGNYGNSLLPFGSGLKIQAKLKTTRDEWKKYATDVIEIPENQIFIQIPTLLIGEGNPKESDDGKVLVSGQIINEDGKPIPGVTVSLNYNMPGHMSIWVTEVMTDNSGQWKKRIPKEHSHLSVTIIHPEYIKQSWLQFAPEEMLNGTNKITMKKGLLLKGIVKNERGEPLENALVDTGGSNSWTPYSEVMENHTTPRTLSDGSFSVGGLAPETINIVVSAFGYAPKQVVLDIVKNMEPIEISLDKGRTYTCQVVDANDNPIEAVNIELDEWRLGNNQSPIVNLTQTDSNGIFKMENLPYEGTITLYYAKSKSGLIGFRKELPNEYPEIDKVVMYPVPVFTGKVIDAETEKPITKFTLISGIKAKNFRPDGSVSWSTYYKDEVRSSEGKFSYKWTGFAISYPFDGQCELKVEAEGYLYETAPPITLGQKIEPAVIRMTKGTPFTGTITDSEGKPIPGAEVGWVGPDSRAFLNDGKFDQQGFANQTQTIVKTDRNGQFKLPPSRDEGLIVAIHEDSGYESISSNDFENGSQIKLKPWAKIEGTIISSDENRKEYNVIIDTAVSDEEANLKKIHWMFNNTTYSQKNFVINYVPSEPFYICQYIDSERMKREYLEPQPGQTYKVELSDEPGVVSGRIIEPEPLKGKELPQMSDIKISSGNETTDNNMNLICFWDMEQRPSRNMITQLGKRIQELEEKGISVITINTSDTEQKVLDDWLKEQNINLKVGKITDDVEKTKFKWGVKSLPWLILTDKNNIVIAEGFNLDDLDEKISSSNKESDNINDTLAAYQRQIDLMRGTSAPNSTGKTPDNNSKVVIKGKYVSNNIGFNPGNHKLTVSMTYPERGTIEVKTKEDGSFVISDIPANAEGDIYIYEVDDYYPTLKVPEDNPFLEKHIISVHFSNIPAGTYEGIEYDFSKLGHISGQITDYNDKPLKGLWIKPQVRDQIWKTDDNGKFYIEAVPNVDLILNVKRDGFLGELFVSNKFRIEEGEEIVKNIKLSKEISIELEKVITEENRVFDTELTGKIVTKDGKPVSGAKVFLGNTYITMDYSSDVISGKRPKPAWEQGYFWVAYLESKSDGSFRFNKLIPGKSDIWAEHPELGWGYLRNVSTDSKDVKLVLEPQSEKIKYTGKVVDSENKPSANAKIYLFIDRGKILVEQTQSKTDGSFVFELTPPWTSHRYFEILCISENQQPAWMSLPYCSIEDIQIKLKQTSKVLGKVVDSKGNGIANATVRYYSSSDPDYGKIIFAYEMEPLVPTTATDNQGNYVMENVPLGSTVSFEAIHPSHVRDCAWYIPVISKEVKGDNIEMKDGAIVEGTVRYADTNEPAKNIIVTAKSFSTTYRQVTTDSNGKYILEGLDNMSTSDKSMIHAESMESPPEWEGQTLLKRNLRDGLHLTNVDVLLQNSFLSQQQNWLAQKGKIVDGPNVLVFDNCYSPTNGKTEYEDTVTLYNSDGQQQWQKSGFNTTQSSGPNKSIVYNPVDKSIWCADKASDKLIKMDMNGKVLLELKDVKPNSLAVDPKTGNVWVLTIDGLVYGDKIIIFDLSGKKIKELSDRAFNITYSKKEDCFWIVGQEVIKLNRNGEDLMYWPEKFSFVSVSVSINENDGSAWVVERGHPQAPQIGTQPSQDCIWVIEPNGDVRKKIKIELPTKAVVDSKRSVAWVTTYNGVFKMNLDGEILERIPVKGFDLYIEPETGYVWVTSDEGTYRLDSDGKLVWSKETPGGSNKWLCAIPD